MDSVDLAVLYLIGKGEIADTYQRLSRLAREVRRKNRTLTNQKCLVKMRPEEIEFLYKRVDSIKSDFRSNYRLLDSDDLWHFENERDMIDGILKSLFSFLPKSEKVQKIPRYEVNKNLRKEKVAAGINYSNKRPVKIVGKPVRKRPQYYYG